MKLLSSLAFCFLLLVSCEGSDECSGKQVTCPSFNDNLSLQWVPYKAGQQIIFTSATTDNDTFNISNISISDSYQANVTGRAPFCTAQASFNTAVVDPNDRPPFSVNITLMHDQFNGSNVNQTYFEVKGSFFQGAGFADTGLVKSNDVSLTHFNSTAVVGNKTFANVQEVALDTSKTVFKADQI